MLISLLVLRPSIYVQSLGNHGSKYMGPITLLEPLVVLIGRHKDMLVKRSQTRRGIVGFDWGKVGYLG